MTILNGKAIMLAGLKGSTPEIGENGNWWIDGEDTGKPAHGATGATGATGKDGQQGRGYYRSEAILSTTTASIERSRINPTNGKLLVSDTIVDKNGLVFAVTKECDVGDETVYLAYRTSIKGADGLGVPAGGTTGQVLTKLSDADNDTAWKDPSGGGNTASEVLSVRTQLKTLPNTWKSKTWNGFTPTSGHEIWTDGEDIYYSNGPAHYVLNRATDTWESKTWNGLTDFLGEMLWTDGENIYYSYNGANYVLNRATDTWESKTWNGFTWFVGGGYIWTDGEDIYYSNGNVHYVLNRATDTWESKTWNGFTQINGNQIWTDGEDIYYSNGNVHYVLNRATDTWESKTWNGFTQISGGQIWTDGEDIYYSNGNVHYVLNRATDTWESKTWNGFTWFVGGGYIWTDGENTYHTDEYASHVLSPVIKSIDPSLGLKTRERYYSKPTDGIPETDLSADVQAKLNSGGAQNLLKGDVTVTVADGSLNNLVELGYPLGISADKSYKVEVEYNGEIIDILIKSSDWQKNETAVGGIAAINNNVRIVVSDGMSADRSINPNTSCLGIDRGNTSGSLSVVFKSITEYTEVVADKVKNPLKITVNGEEKTYDGSEAVEVDINAGSNYKIKQISVSSGETMSSVVTKITNAVAEELTAQGKTSAIVSVVLNGLMIADAVMGGSTNNRAFLETSYQVCTTRVTQNAIVFTTPLVRAVGDSTSSVWGSGIWAVSVQFGKFNSNIAISTGGGGIGGSGAGFKDLSNFVSDNDTTIDLIFY